MRRGEVDWVRRKLLQTASYVPPAILGVLFTAQLSHAAKPGKTKKCKGGTVIVISAGGNACCPCVPGDPAYDPIKCQQKRCELGNCAACVGSVWPSVRKCQKEVGEGGCTNCTCVPIDPANPNGPAICQ